MLLPSLTLFTALVALVSARPPVEKRQNVVYVTKQATVTAQEVVTATPASGSAVTQVQVLIHEIAAQYTYSSARTVFAIPTVMTTTVTQTVLATPYLSNGATITPSASTTVTDSITANVQPTGTAAVSPVVATLPLVSALIGGATVTVSAQTITYYTTAVSTIAAAQATAVQATSATTLTTMQTQTATGAIAESTQSAFISTILTSMNAFRAQHEAVALTWDDSLAAGALSYAQSCVMQPSTDPSFGETLAAGTATDPTFYIDLWYGENSSYNYNAPGFSDSTGHYTQLVWAATTSVGCGFASGCGEYSNYLVCRYSTPGNVVGGTNNDQFFIQNVLA